MCGIAGIVHFKKEVNQNAYNHQTILDLLKHRGPDFLGYTCSPKAVFYHSRLSIIDTTPASNQPFEDETHVLVYNGEIFNYKSIPSTPNDLKTRGDVEVLFKLLKNNPHQHLNALNGFFSFAFYNKQTHELFLGRDRLGIKPLYYYCDAEKFAFASELKPLLEIIGPKEINPNQLYSYFRLNYCAGKESIFKHIYKLMPGEIIGMNEKGITHETWYYAPKKENTENLYALLTDAVKLRLNADVPVGTYLSGGLDSSIISAIAKQHKPDLHTFSLGFADNAFLDESYYAELVAKHIKSNHHSFKLKEEDFLQHIDAFLQSIDEPFADSSAFNFYVLSKQTKQHVKVVLSGDGADELFKGYQKHKAIYLSKNKFLKITSAAISPLLQTKHHSRESNLKNLLRKLAKFGEMGTLNVLETQKFLASISQHSYCEALLKKADNQEYFNQLFQSSDPFKKFALNDTFDLQTVLSDDMLYKTDRFSMQHGLEVRNPFLDFRVMEFALNLDIRQKINGRNQKIILKNTFGHLLPKEITRRQKKGFELPLQSWLSGKLAERLGNDWLNKQKITDEGFLNLTHIETLRTKLLSAYPEDSAPKLWAIVVFEQWFENFKKHIKIHA